VPDILWCSVATCSRCGGILHDDFVRKFAAESRGERVVQTVQYMTDRQTDRQTDRHSFNVLLFRTAWLSCKT